MVSAGVPGSKTVNPWAFHLRAGPARMMLTRSAWTAASRVPDAPNLPLSDAFGVFSS